MTEPVSVLKVDSLNPQLYGGTDEQLQQFLLLACVVAGKTAATQQKKLDAFLADVWRETRGAKNSFEALARLSYDKLMLHLTRVRMGQYNRLAPLIQALATQVTSGVLNLRTCGPRQLEMFQGIGPKTSRFFLLYTRRDIRVAVLDTHILQWMRKHRKELGLPRGCMVPKATPTGARYALLEQAFLRYCDTHNLKPSDFDLEIWKKGSQK
jgi:endonuclease III